ncbi:MAG: hypothetical protein IKN95_09380 [Lachnospiraceae bacterium]|nr:hypothetical protein [Lachnospiraceae bacterium]
MSQSVKDNKSAVRSDVKTTKPANKRSATAKRYLRYLSLIVIAGIIGVVIALVKYFGPDKIKRNSSVTIQFTYDGAAKNQTPTGEKFSIDGIKSDQVLNDAIASVGLASKYTADALRSSIVVKGQYPADVIDKIKDFNSLYNFGESRDVSINNYYPTTYSIVLYDDFDPSVSSSDMEKLIKAIGETYRNYFINNYIYSYNPEKIQEMLVLDNYDFAYRIRIIKLHLQGIKNYASEMYEKDKAFRSGSQSFNDIVIKCRNLENDSIGNIEAAVMTDVLSVSAARLRNQYEYEIKILENEKSHKNANLEELKGLIDSYELDGIMYLGSGDAMVKVERNSKETYEKLVDMKKELTERIVEIDSEIEKYKSFITDMDAASLSTEAKKTLVSGQIQNAYDKTVEIEKLFSDMVADYNATLVAEESVDVKENRFVSGKIFSTGFIAMAVKCAAPLCIIVMIICSFHAFLVERKKYAKRNQEVSA